MLDFDVSHALTLPQGEEIMWGLLGHYKIMALGSCVDNTVTVRNMSCLFYGGKVWFKTDRNFRKTQQLFANPKVALCWNGVQIEGTAQCMGLVVEEEGRVFETAYNTYLKESYNKFSHVEDEIIFAVTPHFVELWDTDTNGLAFQILLEYNENKATVVPYDHG